MKINYFFILIFFLLSCEPFVDTIDEERDCINYSKESPDVVATKDTIHVMTWNIRFGCGTEILWFGDACGERSVLKREEVFPNLDRVIAEINRIHPDVLLLQEVDVVCKRTSYIDEMQYIMDNTYFGYGYYGTTWHIQFIPSDGIGRINFGNAILSVWPIKEAKLNPLPLREDQDALTHYFYVRETVMSCKIEMPNGLDFYAVNAHLSAFATDDTKKRQLETYVDICKDLTTHAIPALVTGGDFNLLPPNSDSLDYCDEDGCSYEHFHSPGDDPMHKEGSNYTPEITWLNLIYDSFSPSLPLDVYKANQQKYFSHATVPPPYLYDRTLDYLFANRPWVENSHITHQDLRKLSDHAPVSALLRLDVEVKGGVR